MRVSFETEGSIFRLERLDQREEKDAGDGGKERTTRETVTARVENIPIDVVIDNAWNRIFQADGLVRWQKKKKKVKSN